MTVITSMAKQSNIDPGGVPDPEVPAKPIRRSFSARYKLEILERADKCTQEGELGELLRKEGLYSSHLSTWRKQREAGAASALGKKRGRKAKPVDQEKIRLQRENERLRQKLAQAEQIIEIQKKVASLLGIPLATDDSDGSK
jgi:transposase